MTEGMLRLSRPLDLLAVALAAVLTGLGVVQLRSSAAFSGAAERVTATVVDVESSKRGLLDGQRDSYATVEFEVDGETVESRLAEPLERIGLDPEEAVGNRISVYRDPAQPAQVRFTATSGRDAALVLFALALGALVAPAALRRTALVQAATPGGG